MSLSLSDGSEIISTQPTVSENWVALATKNPKVQDALYFFQSETSWWSLRKVYELIKEDLGDPNRMEKHVEATRNEIESFWELASSPKVSGREAVHAPTAYYMRRILYHSPMSLADGETFIRGLLKDWLQWVLKQPD